MTNSNPHDECVRGSNGGCPIPVGSAAVDDNNNKATDIGYRNDTLVITSYISC